MEALVLHNYSITTIRLDEQKLKYGICETKNALALFWATKKYNINGHAGVKLTPSSARVHEMCS